MSEVLENTQYRLIFNEDASLGIADAARDFPGDDIKGQYAKALENILGGMPMQWQMANAWADVTRVETQPNDGRLVLDVTFNAQAMSLMSGWGVVGYLEHTLNLGLANPALQFVIVEPIKSSTPSLEV